MLYVAAWLAKEVVTNRISRETDLFRSDLSSKANAEIERLKSELQIAALEHEVRFTKLHERRAEVIARLYSLLVELEDIGKWYVLVGGYEAERAKRDEAWKTASDKIKEFYSYFEQHQIYFAEDICAIVTQFAETVRKSVVGVWIYAKYQSGPPNFVEEQNKVLFEAVRVFEDRIPALKIELREEFRRILGD